MNIAAMIDHTVLKPDTTKETVLKVCQEARDHGFWSVCVNPYYVTTVKEALQGTDVKVTAVIGFPLGANISEVKAFETKLAIRDGADEIDMVLNVGAMKNGEYDVVESDIKAVVDALEGDVILKVILENCLLTKDEIKIASELSVKAGAHYVKTSTGFSTGGATVEDIRLMRATVGPEIGVKASGGVRTTEDAIAVIEAGASRIGASSSVSIVEGTVSHSDY